MMNINLQGFISYFRYHSINTQIIVDSDHVIRNVVAQWPGSVHVSVLLSSVQPTTKHHGRREHETIQKCGESELSDESLCHWSSYREKTKSWRCLWDGKVHDWAVWPDHDALLLGGQVWGFFGGPVHVADRYYSVSEERQL